MIRNIHSTNTLHLLSDYEVSEAALERAVVGIQNQEFDKYLKHLLCAR